MIENSVGTKMFNSLYAEVDGEKKDILEDGNLSCACFVSSVMYLFEMIDMQRARTESLKKFLDESPNFVKVDCSDAEPGDIAIYGEVEYPNGRLFPHSGFVKDANTVVSTNYKKKAVDKHALAETPSGQKLEAIYRYSAW